MPRPLQVKPEDAFSPANSNFVETPQVSQPYSQSNRLSLDSSSKAPANPWARSTGCVNEGIIQVIILFSVNTELQ